MEAITKYIENTMQNGGTTDNRQIRKVCEQNGINLDEHITKVKEAVEIGLMHVARNIAQSDKPLRKKYDELIDLYNRQPYVGTKKTLKQMVLQQYSTPLPISFLMSEFVKSKSNSALYFEPSAGNGFLTISLPQENTICNEIDRYRLDNLKKEHYRKVSEQDARQPFGYNRIFDGVITNPPFLKGQETNTMIFNALETMKDSGRCAILRDGNAQFTEYAGTKLRSSFTGFYDRLFQEYNVVKIININAKKIYAKQGTSFFMHIILINGRRANKLSDDDSMHRVYNPEIDKIELAGFEELWEYFLPYIAEDTVFDERETMRMAFNHLTKELGFDKGREMFEWYCKTYNVGISDPMPSTVKWEIFGTDKTFRELDRIQRVPELLTKELELLQHGLGTLEPDFVIEYHCNGEIYYNLSEARKHGSDIKAYIFGTDITKSVSDTDTDFDVAHKLCRCEYEYVLHGLVNKYKKLKKNELYRVVFTKYSYLCHTDKDDNLIIDKRYDTRETNKISGIYATHFGRPNTTRSISNISNIQKKPIYARQTCKGYIQNSTNNRIRFVKNSSSTLTGTRPTHFAGLDGLGIPFILGIKERHRLYPVSLWIRRDNNAEIIYHKNFNEAGIIYDANKEWAYYELLLSCAKRDMLNNWHNCKISLPNAYPFHESVFDVGTYGIGKEHEEHCSSGPIYFTKDLYDSLTIKDIEERWDEEDERIKYYIATIKTPELLLEELKLIPHVLGGIDPDFVKYQNFIKKSIEKKHYKGELDCTELVSEYNRNKASNMLKKEITKFYLISDDLRHLQKHSKENEYEKGQISLTMTDFLRIPEILSNPDELILPQSNPKNGQGIAFIKTFADGKQYCILIDKYEDGELSPKTGYKKPLRGLNGFYSVHDRCPAKQSPNLTSVTPKVPRRFVAPTFCYFQII